jgi:pantothenate kinase type III
MSGSLRLRFTVNVGNTHISVCEWSEGLATAWPAVESSAEGARSLAEKIAAATTSADAVLAAGVVPALKTPLVKFLRERSPNVKVFRKDIAPQIEIIPAPAAKVGDDRIAVALGALSIDAAVPWVVADIGTALTCNAISPGPPPRFEGGLIVPGAAMSLKAMASQTAQLPGLAPNPQTPDGMDFIGRSTGDAMRWGVLIAQASALAAMVAGQSKRLGRNTRVAFTGGGATALSAVIKKLALPAGEFLIDPLLLHHGLAAAWKDGARP